MLAFLQSIMLSENDQRGILADPHSPSALTNWSVVMLTLFDTVIESASDSLAGPWRAPQQMLSAQSYGVSNHAARFRQLEGVVCQLCR
jgi:hypothetical protein